MTDIIVIISDGGDATLRHALIWTSIYIMCVCLFVVVFFLPLIVRSTSVTNCSELWFANKNHRLTICCPTLEKCLKSQKSNVGDSSDGLPVVRGFADLRVVHTVSASACAKSTFVVCRLTLWYYQFVWSNRTLHNNNTLNYLRTRVTTTGDRFCHSVSQEYNITHTN